MVAYNPTTGQTIEISEYGFRMLQNKGWTRAVDQTVRRADVPQSQSTQPTGPAVDMKAEIEKRKAETQGQTKYKPVPQPKSATEHEVTLDGIPGEQPVAELPVKEPDPAKVEKPKKAPHKKQSPKNKTK